jgi:hypothetical protein
MKPNYRGYRSYPGELDGNHEIFINPQIDSTPLKISLSKLLEYINSNATVSSSSQVVWTSVDSVELEDEIGSALGTGVGSKEIVANDIQVGTVYRISIQGFVSTSSGTPEDVVLTLKIGSTSILSTTLRSINFPGLSDEPISAEFTIGIKQTGASGSVISTSKYHTAVYSLNITGSGSGGSPTPVSVNFTQNRAIDIEVNAGEGATWKTGIISIEKLN